MASNNKQGRSTSIAIWGTAVVVVILAVYAVHSLTRQRVEVHSATVSYQDLVNTKLTNGKVELTDDFQVHALAPGQVQALYVHLNQHVLKGQLLLKLNDAAAQATLAHAQAALVAAEVTASNVSHGGSQEERATYDADLSRANQQRQQDTMSLATARKLLAQGAASQAEVIAAERRIQIDETNLQALHARASQRYTPADVESANAQVADAQAAVGAAQSALANDIITSKIDGTVYYLPVAQYDYVQANDDLIYVGDLNHLRITAYFDEPDIGSLAVGQAATITWGAKAGSTWHGHVSQTPMHIKAYQNRFVGECVITVDDADGILAPDADVNIEVTVARHPHVLVVPHDGAIHFDHEQPYVFRIQDGKLVRTNVVLGLVTLTEAEIVSGLAQGDTVATNATSNVELTNGESVTVVPGP